MNPAELRAAREALHMTQKELGEAIGRHPNVIARYERGEMPIPPIVGMAVAGLLR
jgi:transcriptional regulator with XRE-family HTH domain